MTDTTPKQHGGRRPGAGRKAYQTHPQRLLSLRASDEEWERFLADLKKQDEGNTRERFLVLRDMIDNFYEFLRLV